uniref:Uncharacterized protein n=1 Tax=mine drainage metagenome TaxID=410659 RepID=E6QLA3_9ZZZZ
MKTGSATDAELLPFVPPRICSPNLGPYFDCTLPVNPDHPNPLSVALRRNITRIRYKPAVV